MSKILEGLNEKQQKAVVNTEGPLLVIAGAGSGKTRALTHRIAYLIKEKGIKPWNILAVTFTNKAANEMKERVKRLLNEENEAALPTVGTFHATCVRILRKHIHLLGYENAFTIYDTADQQILMKHVMKDLQIDDKQLNPKAVLNHISNAKNQLLGPEKYSQLVSNYFTEKVAEIYKHYQNRLLKSSALDFDDIIMKTVELFQKQPEVLDYFQEKYRYISVDEYQDTNHAQYVLTNQLAEKYRNICVIGDSDQSIYSFRGANIQNILDFEKDYPELKIVLLEQNYRSSQTILDAAHSIIKHNKQRKEKKLWTDRDGGDKIVLKALENEREEGVFIGHEIEQLLRTHETPSYKDFVVLYRTNAQSRVMEETFLRFGIPYKIIGGIKFYQRKEIKDIVAYLRVIQNTADTVSLTRIINTPPRKIGPKTIETVQQFALQTGTTLFESMSNADQCPGLAESKAQALIDFTKLIKELQKKNTEFSAAGVIKHVLDYSGYKKFISDGTIEGESRLENIYELINVASKYDNLEAGISLNIFLEEIALIADVDSLDDEDNAVTMMTIHSAKGLEFPVVFIAGLEDGVLPHSRSLLERDELEEERRLMYVAVTRAQHKLYLLRAKNRMLYGEISSTTPSQFIANIPTELMEMDENDVRMHKSNLQSADLGYTPIPFEDFNESEDNQLHDGDKVLHNSFGEGRVVSVMGGVATIAFDNPKYGVKKLALSIAPLKKIN